MQSKSDEIRWSIENDILSKTYKLGEKLPPMRQLSEKYGVGINTIQKSIKELCDENIIMNNGIKGLMVHPLCYNTLFNRHKAIIAEKIKNLVIEATSIGLSSDDIFELINLR